RPRRSVRLGFTGERTKIPMGYLDYPARTHRLTAAEARDVLRALGKWARLTLQLDVVAPHRFPRSNHPRPFPAAPPPPASLVCCSTASARLTRAGRRRDRCRSQILAPVASRART